MANRIKRRLCSAQSTEINPFGPSVSSPRARLNNIVSYASRFKLSLLFLCKLQLCATIFFLGFQFRRFLVELESRHEK